MSDAEALHRVFGDREVMYFGAGAQSLEYTHGWIQDAQQQLEARGYAPYAVVLKQSHEVIGYCGLFYFPDVAGQAEVEIGYRLVRAAWGNGYATEAVCAVRDDAFDRLALPRLIALIDPGNSASIRVAEKAGMRYEKDVMFEGYTHPDRVYAITNPAIPG